MENRAPREPLSLRSQAMLVGAAALAAAAGVLLFLLVPGEGVAESGPRMARLVPGVQQNAAMQFETVHTRIFQTETVTDGYVAANGGWTLASAPGSVAHGVPVLQGQSADLIQAEGDLATARAQLVAAAANERRQHALYQADGASLKDWQQAEVDAATAASGLAAARNKLRLLGKDEQGILALERRADGSASRIFTIGDSSLVWLVANVREADAPHIHAGDRMSVSVPSLSGRNLFATVNYIGSTVDPVTHRLPVAGLYKNTDGALKPNMLASFDILDRDSVRAPAVPKNAIIYEGEQARVWVVQPDGNFTLRDVTVGRSHDGYAEITRGLSGGERVVTAGALFIDQASAGG